MDEKIGGNVNAQNELKTDAYETPDTIIEESEENQEHANSLLDHILRNKCRISQAVEISKTIHEAFLTTCKTLRELRVETNE